MQGVAFFASHLPSLFFSPSDLSCLAHFLRGPCGCSPHFSTVSCRPQVRSVVDSDPPRVVPPRHVSVRHVALFIQRICILFLPTMGLHLALVPLLGFHFVLVPPLGLNSSFLLDLLLLSSRLPHLSFSLLLSLRFFLSCFLHPLISSYLMCSPLLVLSRLLRSLLFL